MNIPPQIISDIVSMAKARKERLSNLRDEV